MEHRGPTGDDEVSSPSPQPTPDDGSSDADRPADTVKDYVGLGRRVNAGFVGNLTLHYKSRDVTLPLDGATAMHIISTWQERPASMMQYDSRWRSAHLSWIGIDLDELMGWSWEPDAVHATDSRGVRVAVDPHT